MMVQAHERYRASDSRPPRLGNGYDYAGHLSQLVRRLRPDFSHAGRRVLRVPAAANERPREGYPYRTKHRITRKRLHLSPKIEFGVDIEQ